MKLICTVTAFGLRKWPSDQLIMKLCTVTELLCLQAICRHFYELHVHRDAVNRSYRFGDCFLSSFLGLVGRTTNAIQPEQEHTGVATSSKAVIKAI